MELKEAQEQLEQTDLFKEWKNTHDTFFFAHGFLMPEESPQWQLGYSDGDTVTTFLLEPLEKIENQEANKQEGKKIEAFSGEKVLPLAEAQDVFKKTKEEKYPQETIMKHVVIVQHLGQDVYNMTGLTQSFKTLNIRIDMLGNVIEDSLQALVEQA